MATTEAPLFDRIIAQSQSRSRSGSANSASLNGSLPPPPRRRKLQAPAVLTTSSSTALPMQRPPMAAPATQIAEASDVNPFRNPSLADAESLRRPSPFSLYNESGQHAQKYADSLSSLDSYSNLFYKPEDDASSSPIIRPADPPMDQNNFDDAVSMEDYSNLLYPELQSPVSPSNSPRHSIDLHGPPIRKRMPSFASQASHDGPESPVEFANIRMLSLPPPVPVLEGYRPSKVDILLGMGSQSSSRHGSTDRFLKDQTRPDSFMEFDIQSFRANPGPTAETALRSQSPMSDEMPTFAPRNMRSVMASQPNNSIGEYRALVESVDHTGTTDALDSRQILVDGSDKQQWSTPSNHSSNHSSASSPPLEARLSTTNSLDKKERAEAVRKNRKILQVLGPGVVPSAQAFARTGRTTPTPDTPEIRHDPLHRTTRSYSLVDEDVRSEALHKTRARELLSHRPLNLQAKSSWKALDQDTIYLSASGRRHSSPLSPTFDSSSVFRRFDSDAASLSSLGSIIVGLERIGDKDGASARSGSPASFMEMSDDEGARTPKRRPSIESGEREVPIRQRTGRAASLNDLLTISGVLESPRRVSVPDTPITDYSLSIASRNSSRSISDRSFQSSFYRRSDISDDYGLGNVDGDEAGLEKQRKRQKLAKIHRYLGSKVPPELVLGYSSTSPPFAIPTVVLPAQCLTPEDRDQEMKKRRRSSSATMYQHTHGLDTPRRSEAENRAQDTFTDVERMMRIKRAQKIEQIFGESPSRPMSMSGPPRPSSAQGLSRNKSAAPTIPLKRTTVATPTPVHPQTERGFKPRSPFISKDGQRPSTSGSSRPSTAHSTTGLMSSYQKDVERDKKSRGKHHQAHSAQITNTSAHFPVGIALGSPEDLYDNDVLDISANAMAGYGSKSPVMPGVPTSRHFMDYRNSLNSLSRILDHAVLDSDEEENDDPDLQSSALLSDSIDTQRMLQPRASLASINSVATTSTFATLTPDPMAFQARRRRAAKLAQFFGASYRDLFGEVLVRIERGMLEEARAGQISEEEIEHLMTQLTRLKSRQFQLS